MKIRDIVVESSKLNTLSERKRKRKRKTTRTVYGGWWGGYPLDNSSGEGGGEGVAERLNELAPNGFNGGDDDNDLQLYINVAKKLNMKKYKPSTAHDLIAKKMAELVDVVDDDKVDYARHMARKAQGLPNMLDQDVAESTLSWSTLSDSLSVEDKLTIFEEYHCKNTLLESNSESSVEYFKSLFELSDEPVPNKKYIVVPLMLVSDRIMQLDSPSVMKYVESKNGVLIFTHNNTEREYPSTTLQHRSLSHTFTFASSVAYDKFRIALRLQFDVDLPNVDRNIDEASYVNEVAEGRQEYALNLDSIEEKFGQIKLQGGIVRNNQTLLRYLAKNNLSTAVFDHLIEQKIDKITKNKIITESIDANDKSLKAIFSQFNNFSTGNRVKVGDSVSVLNLEALQLSGNTIELTGFLQPQTITAVNNNYVEFESGEIFPKQPILQLRMWRQVIFFHSVEHAKKCLMVMQLHSGKTDDWEFSINVQQDVREASSAAQQAAIAINMKRAGKKPQHNK